MDVTDNQVPATFRRRLVLIAVSEYDEGTQADRTKFQAGISAQVAVVEDWWGGAGLDDGRRFTPSHPPKPLHSVHDLRAFLIDEDLVGAHEDEALIIYITGHGLAPQGSQHFLRLTDTRLERPLSTAFPTAELVTAALDSRAEHVLVMVDSCFSGRLRAELDCCLKALHPDRKALHTLVVLAAGNEDSTPRLRAFTSALAAVHAHCADETSGYARSHLSWEEFHTVLGTVWNPTEMADIEVLWPPSSVGRRLAASEPSPCLPNPGHADTTLVEDARSQVGWSRAELDDYWITRATGQMSGDVGWYFTGRASLISQMNDFLAGDDGALVVTGQAGSGKSALLARLVTLSDPRFRADPAYQPYLDTIPEHLQVAQNAVDAAVLARNTDPQELSAAIYKALTGQPAPSDRDTTEHLRAYVRTASSARGRPFTVVVDGIDEARSPRRIITDVLRSLAAPHSDGSRAVRLILGIRSSPSTHRPQGMPTGESGRGLLELLQQATSARTPLRTDDDTARNDIADYTAALLRATPATGTRLLSRGDHDVARTAAAVALEVAPSFLDARLAAQQLHGADFLPSADDWVWRSRLRAGTEELLRQDLADVAEHSRIRPEDLLAVLRATAFALGAGLPWARVWPAAVRGLEPRCESPEACIRVVRDSRLTGYLTTAVEDGRTVYRPIHERVAEVLRTDPDTLLLPQTPVVQALPGLEHLTDDPAPDGAPAHRRLTEAFISLLTDLPEQPPHPYLRRHLIGHAAAGNVLDDEHVPASFLPFESQGRVRGALGLPVTADATALRLAAWSRIEPFLGNAPPAARADSLALAEQAGDAELPACQGAPPRLPMLAPRWNRLQLPTNVLAGTTVGIWKLVAFHTADGSAVIAAAHVDGTITMWDAHTGVPFGAPLTGLGRQVRAAVVLPARAERADPLLVVGSDTGLWQCDPETGRTRRLVSGRIRALALTTTRYGAPRLAVATPRVVFNIDPYTGDGLTRQPYEVEERPHDRRVLAVHALEAIPVSPEQTLLAIGQDGNRVPVLDAETLEPVRHLTAQGLGTAALQAFTTRKGKPRLATASRSGKGVRLFDPLSGQVQQHAPIRQSVASMTIYDDHYHEPLLALGSGVDGSINLFDTLTGHRAFSLPTEHTRAVRGLAVFGTQWNPLLVSGSLDSVIRLWNPRHDDTTHAPITDPSAEHIALVPQRVGPARLISSDQRGGIRVHAAGTGLPAQLLHDHVGEPLGGVVALAAAVETPDFAVAYANGALHALTGVERRVLHEPVRSTRRNRPAIHRLAFLPQTPGQGPAVVAGFIDSSWVTIFSLDGDKPERETFYADGPVRALAATRVRTEAPLIAAAGKTVRLIRPDASSVGSLPAHIGSVRSLAFLTPATAPDLLLATGGADGAIRLWDPLVPRHEALPTLFGHRGKVGALAVLHHRNRSQPLLVSAGTDDTTIRVWDCHAGEEILRLVTGAPVTTLAVQPPDITRPVDNQPTIIFGSPKGIAAAAVHL
ncbi:AAA family ATPase [Kitasatospora sp. NPDC057965]|uniref:AAA family ATPase n=1 Tax=Kitasatospora sp. NPDC057965 TaxID=3346291 RepID=UPI0036DE1651